MENKNDKRKINLNSGFQRNIAKTIRQTINKEKITSVYKVKNETVKFGHFAKSYVKSYTVCDDLGNMFRDGNISNPIFYEIIGKDKNEIFSYYLNKAKTMLGDLGASVTVYDNYSDKRVFLTIDGSSGFSLNGDDIISVFSDGTNKVKNEGYISVPILLLATQLGGKKLDAFDIYLPHIYCIMGFKAVARIPWIEKYKPGGWNKQLFKPYNNGEPDVLFMIYDPNYFENYKGNEGVMVKLNDSDKSYESAVSIQTCELDSISNYEIRV